jgi:glycosyltransferase involved in cell wall biosynthesis
MELELEASPQGSAEAGTTRPSLVLAFVGVVVPDRSEFITEVFSRAGNMTQLNVLRSLAGAGVRVSLVLSFLPTGSYPRAKRLWIPKQQVFLFEGCRATLLPFINIQPIKQLYCGFGVFWRLLLWGIRNRSKPKVVCLYNLSRPPAIFHYAAARLVGAKIAALLYDITIPGVEDPNDVYHRLIFRMTKWIVPRLDGRIVINEAVVRDFAPGKHFLLVDGGVSLETMRRCEQFRKCAERPEFTLAFAGRLWEGNGIPIMLKSFARLSDPTYRLCIAGKGGLEDEVRTAAARDHRIIYKGFLDHEGVMQMYESADVLLNIRLTKLVNLPYVFPSKFLEHLSSGRPVITTAPAHTEKEYGDLCFILKEENPEGLTSLIEKVRGMGAAERTGIASRAKAFMMRERTWERQGTRIAEYLAKKVLNGRGGPMRKA